MSASTDAPAKGSTRRRPREALDRWLAEADALLNGSGQAGASPAVPVP